MFLLNWNGSNGQAASNGRPWTLRRKPGIGIDFDAIGYCVGGGWRSLDGQTMPLTKVEVDRIESWLSSQDPDQGTDGADPV